MAEFKGSKTEHNLMEAFAGESQARNRYGFYAAVAQKEGYQQVAALFLESAEHERMHAKLQLKALGGIGDTLTNLKAAAAGEFAESAEMYPRMAAEAREEGFLSHAALFEGLAAIEKMHQERFKALLASIEEGSVFRAEEPTEWLCRKCGFVHEGTEPPQICPVCHHPRAHFERLARNY